MQNKLIIGVVGETGSGKTTVCRSLQQYYDCEHIEADRIGHQILECAEVISELVDHYGNRILNSGGIDRAKLSRIVFADQTEMDYLNQVTHWRITQQVTSQIQATAQNLILVDGALLIEAGLGLACDWVMYLYADRSIRRQRLIQGRHIDPDKARQMLERTKTVAFYNQHSDVMFNMNRDDPSILPIMQVMIDQLLKINGVSLDKSE